MTTQPSCPRCGAPGRRFAEKPINGRLTFHCGRCGRLWLVAGDPYATHQDYAVKNLRTG
jgi:transposase-like protein